MDISRSHPFFNVGKSLTKICRPLIQHTPFGYFCYERFYHNGNYLAFCLDPEYCYEIFKNKYLPSLSEMQKNNSHYVYLSPELFWPNKDSYKNIFSKIEDNIVLSNQYNIYHRLCIVFNTPEYVEVFAFGITKNNFSSSINNIVGTFINHIDLLEKFCIYFREASKTLVEQTKKCAIKFDTAIEPNIFSDLNFKKTNDYKIFLDEIKLNNYFLQGKYNGCLLTQREFECLLWVSKDKTAKQIGRILSLSPRTVEDYLTNVKNKLGCESKLELIEVAGKNPLIKSFIE